MPENVEVIDLEKYMLPPIQAPHFYSTVKLEATGDAGSTNSTEGKPVEEDTSKVSDTMKLVDKEPLKKEITKGLDTAKSIDQKATRVPKTEKPATAVAKRSSTTEVKTKDEVHPSDRLLRRPALTISGPITNWRLRKLFSQIYWDNGLILNWLRSPTVDPHLTEFAQLFTASKERSEAFNQKLEKYVAEEHEDPLDHLLWKRRNAVNKQYKDNATRCRLLGAKDHGLHELSWKDILSRSAMLLVQDGKQAIDSPFKDLADRTWCFEVAITALVTMHEHQQMSMSNNLPTVGDEVSDDSQTPMTNNLLTAGDEVPDDSQTPMSDSVHDQAIKKRKHGEGNYDVYYVRRPKKSNVWWSVSEARWDRLSDAMKKKWSHVGWILEGAGEQAPSACEQCEENKLQCWQYKEDARESIGQPGYGCARCKAKQLPCSLKPSRSRQTI